jgi:hypothetical protein
VLQEMPWVVPYLKEQSNAGQNGDASARIATAIQGEARIGGESQISSKKSENMWGVL